RSTNRGKEDGSLETRGINYSGSHALREPGSDRGSALWSLRPDNYQHKRLLLTGTAARPCQRREWSDNPPMAEVDLDGRARLDIRGRGLYELGNPGFRCQLACTDGHQRRGLPWIQNSREAGLIFVDAESSELNAACGDLVSQGHRGRSPDLEP